MSRLALFVAVVAVAAVASAAASTTAASLRTTEQLKAAFQADGYTVTAMHTLTSGMRGIVGIDNNVTLLSTGKGKPMLYVEGTGYEMGFLHGYLMENETATILVDYIDHFIPAMISWKFNQKASHDAKWKKLYDIVCSFLGDLLTDESYKSFNKQVPGTFPAALVEEMKGILDGATAANPNTKVTFNRLITLNYGMDWLSANVFGSKLLGKLLAFAAKLAASDDPRVTPEAFEMLLMLQDDDLTSPAHCDAFAASGAATASGSGSFFARSFQLPTAGVFQNLQMTITYAPTDGRIPMVAAACPGMVGSITAMNHDGFIMAVDTLRSAMADTELVGLNSDLLVRATVHTASNSEDAVKFVQASLRGCPYLYPMSDAAGAGIVLETGKHTNTSVIPNPLQYITEPDLLAALPTADWLAANSKVEYSNGVFVRRMSSQYPNAILPYNKALFELAGLPYNATDLDSNHAFVFPTWEAEDDNWRKIGSRFFSTPRVGQATAAGGLGDVIFCSNFAASPQMRITQMTPGASFFPGHAMQWRFDTINEMLTKAHGTIDLEVAKDIITFLSPDRTPGFWNQTIIPGNPMSAMVEGSIVAADLQKQIFLVKGGYWTDNFLQVTLPAYVM